MSDTIHMIRWTILRWTLNEEISELHSFMWQGNLWFVTCEKVDGLSFTSICCWIMDTRNKLKFDGVPLNLAD